MRLVRRRKQAGDTLIEVMFAFAIFALVAVGSLTIMNQGIATAQRSLEITLVRAQMDAQVEAIRYIHQAYVAAYQKDGVAPTTGPAAEWLAMTDTTSGHGVSAASKFGVTDGDLCLAEIPGARPFIVNARKAVVDDKIPVSSPPSDGSMPPFSQVVYNDDSSIDRAYGIWVEAVPSDDPASEIGFVDFHIRSCWSGAGSGVPVTLGTIVRLYEPR